MTGFDHQPLSNLNIAAAMYANFSKAHDPLLPVSSQVVNLRKVAGLSSFLTANPIRKITDHGLVQLLQMCIFAINSKREVSR